MRVHHGAAEAVLAEQKDKEIPGFPDYLEPELGEENEDGSAELTFKGGGGHASIEAYANAIGIASYEESAPEFELIEAPFILGSPYINQYIEGYPGVWAEREDGRTAGTIIYWLYDGNADTPVVIPEGDPNTPEADIPPIGGIRVLRVPNEAGGRSIVLRVTRGASTADSEPIEIEDEGATEWEFSPNPVPDSEIVRAQPAGSFSNRRASLESIEAEENRRAAARRVAGKKTGGKKSNG
jgi:hypothetical protein